MPAEHVPQLSFLQVMHIHLVASCSMTFSRFSKKEDPQVWAKSFPHLLTLTHKEKTLSPKAMITYKRPYKSHVHKMVILSHYLNTGMF